MNAARRIVVALLAATALTGLARADTPGFVASESVRHDAEASAADAVRIAKTQFNLALDGSEASIDDVERALDRLHSNYVLTTPKPADTQLLPVARAFGAYVGEVYRRNHGAAWGTVTLNGTDYAGLRTDAGVNVWMTGRVLNRIIDGPENNIAEYYRKLASGPAKD